MQVQTIGSNGPTIMPALAQAKRPRRRKLHLPLALTNKPAAHAPDPFPSLSGHDLRRIVASIIG
jgi:hypothetical protein